MISPKLVLSQGGYIYSKEGRPVLSKKQLEADCLLSLNKDRSDKTALTICQCQIEKIDGHFSNKQYKRYSQSGTIDLSGLISLDSVFKKEFQQCFTSSGKTVLLRAEGFEQEYIADCIQGIQKNTEKKLDIDRVTTFCRCQLDMVKTKKISDAEMETLNDPNSLLFYETIYKCGDPFAVNEIIQRNWNKDFDKDILGPESDTLNVLTLNGMTYIKAKMGTEAQVWLFDTGASDLLINNEIETELKKENIITDNNYLGIGEYEMANGMIDSCRRYKINNVQIGKFVVNNVLVSVTDKGKRIIIGKGVLNKFSHWTLNNRDNILVLNR
jgi:hypothetical protein